MHHKNQSGFSAIISIVSIVLVIGILGFIGWRLYSQQSQRTIDATTSNKITNQSPISNQNTTTQQIDPNAGYFVIKEWGVRLKLPSDLSDLEYKLTNFSDDPSDSYADFYTPQLATLAPSCDPFSGTGYVGLGRLLRYPTSNQQPITGGAGRITSFNGYDYYFGGNEAVCLEPTPNNTSIENLLSTDTSEFRNSALTIEDAKGTWLDIKELGVKVFLSNSINDATYAFVKNQPTNGTQLVGISAQSLIDNETNYRDKCISADAPLGSISASSSPPMRISGNAGIPISPDGKFIFKFGSTYYAYAGPQGTIKCGVTAAGTLDDAIRIKMSAFQQAFATIQLDH